MTIAAQWRGIFNAGNRAGAAQRGKTMESIKFTVTIKRAQLRAALIFAADKDIRYYLNGIMLEIDEVKSARLVATDGHRLAVVALQDQPGARAGEYLIPRELIKSVKRATRNTSEFIELHIDGERVTIAEGEAIIAGGKLLDGKFPDWRRVMPDPKTMSGAPGVFKASYLGDIGAAAIELGDKFGACPLIQNEPNNSGLAVFESIGLAVVVMPVRWDIGTPDMTQFYPRLHGSRPARTKRTGEVMPC